MFLHPADMLKLAEQRQIGLHRRAATHRLVRADRRSAAEHSSHDATVITLTSPSGHEDSYAARVA